MYYIYLLITLLLHLSSIKSIEFIDGKIRYYEKSKLTIKDGFNSFRRLILVFD